MSFDTPSYTVLDGPVKPEWQHGVIAIGNFDGVHGGHQALLQEARAIANQKNSPCIALTFTPHPRRFFQPSAPAFLLTDEEKRAQFLLRAGADAVLHVPFNAATSQLSAGDFIQLILHDALQAKHIVVGQNFVFGHGRQGHVETLMAHGFDVTALAPVAMNNGMLYSSTQVRQALQDSNVALATDLLKRPWSVHGVVITGQQRGRTIDVPTANIAWPDNILQPAFGVYAITATLPDNRPFKGVANIGVRPTLDIATPAPLLEAHLFDFNGDLYGQDITIHLHHFIRPEAKFPSFDDMAKQIADDITQARTLLR